MQTSDSDVQTKPKYKRIAPLHESTTEGEKEKEKEKRSDTLTTESDSSSVTIPAAGFYKPIKSERK